MGKMKTHCVVIFSETKSLQWLIGPCVILLAIYASRFYIKTARTSSNRWKLLQDKNTFWVSPTKRTTALVISDFMPATIGCGRIDELAMMLKKKNWAKLYKTYTYCVIRKMITTHPPNRTHVWTYKSSSMYDYRTSWYLPVVLHMLMYISSIQNNTVKTQTVKIHIYYVI